MIFKIFGVRVPKTKVVPAMKGLNARGPHYALSHWLTSSAVLHLTHMVTLTDLFTPAPQHRARC